MSTTSGLLEAGWQHHREGDLERAEQMYQQVLRVEPQRPEALHLLGVVYLQRGQHDLAVERLQQAVAVQPALAAAHQHLGSALQSAGRSAEALTAYREAARLEPAWVEAHLSLANLLAALGRRTEAESSYRAALTANPQRADVLNNLANLLQADGRIDEALAALRTALGLQSGLPEIHFNLGNCLAAHGDANAALAAYRSALALKPDFLAAQRQLGAALAATGQFAEAADCYRAALAQEPSDVSVCSALGMALQQDGQLDEAEACYREALRRQPGEVALQYNLATLLQERGQEIEAESLYRSVLASAADHQGALWGLWIIRLRRNDVAGARAVYQQMLQARPDDAEAHFLLGMSHLLEGDLAVGWPEFEWRLKTKFAGRAYPQPKWDGRELAGQRIVVHSEWGLGDTLQFIRYVPLIEARGGDVVLDVQPSLIPLLELSGYRQLYPKGEAGTPECQWQAPILSLPGIFQTSLETIPADVPYLQIDPRLVEVWRRRLAAHTGFKVGIIWHGRKNSSYFDRSIPLAQFESLAKVPGVELIALQKRDGLGELAAIDGRFEVLDLGEPEYVCVHCHGASCKYCNEAIGSFLDTAAIMKNLDLVVTCDTATVHLAGGLGVPTWVVLLYNSDWRWLEQREDCPWYPTVRLFRQAELDDWSQVFQRMAGELARAVASGRAGGIS